MPFRTSAGQHRRGVMSSWSVFGGHSVCNMNPVHSVTLTHHASFRGPGPPCVWYSEEQVFRGQAIHFHVMCEWNGESNLPPSLTVQQKTSKPSYPFGPESIRIFWIDRTRIRTGQGSKGSKQSLVLEGPEVGWFSRSIWAIHGHHVHLLSSIYLH